MKCYVHHVPGRLRVRVASTKGNPAAAEKLVRRLKARKGVRSIAVNPVTGSVLIQYDERKTNAGAFLAMLKVEGAAAVLDSTRARTKRLAAKAAEAVVWYAIEKAVARCLPVAIAALL